MGVEYDDKLWVEKDMVTVLYFRDFKLPSCFKFHVLSSGLFPGVCSLNANVSEYSVCSIFIGGWVWVIPRRLWFNP
jgi:hypothetical protein